MHYNCNGGREKKSDVMNVPLIVHAVEKYGKEKFDMWINQKHYEIDAPIQPYFYSYRKDLPIDSEKVETIEAHPISDCHKKKNFYKYHFKTRSRLVKARSELTFEDNIPFIIRNRIDNPDVFTKYPHANTLKFLFLDIEQHCPENLPFPTYNEIITSVSYCTNDRKIDTIYLKKETDSDKKLLEKFTEEYHRINPDVIVVFNQGYDIPTILHRCTKNKIHTGKFSKSGKPPLTHGKEDYSIDGVVIYDVYDSVKADQSLSGKVVNRGLKEVSNYFKFPETRSPLKPKEITDLKGTRELIEYNKDDVKRLLFLFDIYWQNIEFNANDLKIPLNTAISMNTSELGMIVIGDEHRRLGIISDGTNYQRYPEIFQRPGKKPSDPNYQGALVDIFQIGLFKPVYKADFSSMYPKIEAEFNLSPDTTTLLEYSKYTGKFSIDEKEYWYVYTIPDNVLKKDMIIQVTKQPGFSSTLVAKFLTERSIYKKKWKETGELKYRALSDNRKVKANGGVYGNMGFSKHPYGFVPIAIATCGIGRECGQLLIDILNELYPNSVIEVDTDGVYFTTNNINKKEIFDLFDKRIRENFKKELALSIDIDEYDKGYFYKSKNYILEKKGKKILHGVALTASSQTLLKKKLIDELSDAKLNGQSTSDIIQRYLKMDFPLNYFAMNIKLGMPIDSYKEENSIARRMALLAKEHLKIKPEVGNQYYYIKSKGGYKLFDISTKEDIDYDYYRDEIKKVVDMFNIENPSSTLDKWL